MFEKNNSTLFTIFSFSVRKLFLLIIPTEIFGRMLDIELCANLLCEARKHLMLPHSSETDSLIHAFLKCEELLICLAGTQLQEPVKEKVDVLRHCLASEGYQQVANDGGWFQKIEHLSFKDKANFSTAVDSLANYFLTRKSC
ncbi:MAG: hypothetical protein R3B84_19135 [Zavarzinella sp.]